MAEITPLKINNPLVGKWTASDGFSDVVVIISCELNKFQVSVLDQEDNEVAEVYDVRTENEALLFNVHWPSTGRFVKYRFLALHNGTVGVTYTYSGQDTWQKLET